MDFDEILTDSFFNYGWCYKKKISFFGKENDIQFVFEAYPETEKINSKQKDSFLDFYSNINILSEASANEVNAYIERYVGKNYSIENDVQLKKVLVKQDGKLVLLCEAAWDIENSLGIQIYPKIEIGSQDAFL